MLDNDLLSRRRFLEFMGRATLATAVLETAACASKSKSPWPITPIEPTLKDDLVLSPGLQAHIVLTWGQRLNAREEFGFNNDYLAYIPLSAPNEALLWVNHESPDPHYLHGWVSGQTRTKAQIDIERRSVGGSIAHIKNSGGRWSVVADSRYNRRLDGFTSIPLIAPRDLSGTRTAIGTFANCAGGVTPWGSVLTCEENYNNFVGDIRLSRGQREFLPTTHTLAWTPHVNLPPEHYGWVVEVDPKTARAKKLTALGRFSHECATTVVAGDGRAVVYTGDDADQEHLYKFIADKPGSLDQGELFVANLERGQWISLDRKKHPQLQAQFRDQLEVLVYARQAAKLVGATPLARPEDVEQDPVSKAMFVTLTMSKSTGDRFGRILKIEEKDQNPLALEFRASTFAAGGIETGFANPDNMVFDRRGGLWLCTDMSETTLGTETFKHFGNNGLFYIPMSGPHAGRALQVASSPRGAELTGPCFSPDGRTLFLSVQHPGEHAHRRPELTSHWPDGANHKPRPSVVAIQGPALDALTYGSGV